MDRRANSSWKQNSTKLESLTYTKNQHAQASSLSPEAPRLDLHRFLFIYLFFYYEKYQFLFIQKASLSGQS